MDNSKISFLPEIQSIMYAMGDCRRPLTETARIIEEMVLHEMHKFICRAQAMAEERGVQWMTAEDLIFLLRKDRILLQRLVNTLKMNDLKFNMKLPSSSNRSDEDESTELFDETAGDCSTPKAATSKRMKFCETVLEKLDPTGDLLTLLDEGNNNNDDAVKRERMMRAAAYAASIDSGEYMRYTEARQVSLLSKTQNGRRFRDWLFGDSVDENGDKVNDGYFTDFKPTSIVLEILSFLASETIATLMDCAFLVKRECNFDSSSSDHFNDAVRLRPQTVAGSVLSPSTRTPSSGDFLPSPQPAITVQKCPRNSQQVAWLLAQQARQNKSLQQQQNQQRSTTDATVAADYLLTQAAVQPWEMREAIRRLRYYNGERSVFLLYDCNNSQIC